MKTKKIKVNDLDNIKHESLIEELVNLGPKAFRQTIISAFRIRKANRMIDGAIKRIDGLELAK